MSAFKNSWARGPWDGAAEGAGAGLGSGAGVDEAGGWLLPREEELVTRHGQVCVYVYLYTYVYKHTHTHTNAYI